ncbi:hypothetical protein [Aureibacillus halotolerans]|uniref:Uncharacterized protein n=1 Tax=Aureibacillus halotolerans TaxID=1508390 RepID=A0A4R6TXE1_9BACI|nr:hypothetical protein [Aureibacillus halotolerans]TDQ37442.1 hypothetical protein EV213_11377 [Aureibacillus halotolerans]
MLEKIIRSPFTAALFLFIVTSMIYGALEHEDESRKYVWLGLGALVIFFILILIHNKRHPKRRIRFVSFTPYELHDEDEGQRWVINKACRKVYMFYYFAVPFSMIALTFFPLFPLVPLALFFILGVTQYTIFWWDTRHYYKQ